MRVPRSVYGWLGFGPLIVATLGDAAWSTCRGDFRRAAGMLLVAACSLASLLWID
jgi:hypothetical protein